MIRSMTAFAGSEAEIGDLTINCELRSVNHRYCDISLKLPERLRFVEADIRSAIAARLKRGKIECTLNYKKQSVAQKYDVNMAAVKGLLAATAEIEQQMNTPQPFSALDVLAFPGIQQEAETNKILLQAGIKELIDQALIDMLAAREREGAKLGLLIEDRCGKALLLVSAAEKRMPEVLKQLREKLTVRIADLVAEPYANVQVQNKDELVADIEAQIDQLLGLIIGLLFLAIIIAVLGITNPRALSIIERTREIGLLRAVGMTRFQTSWMVRWEAVIVAVFGAIMGVGIGVFLGWAVVQALGDEGLGSFAIPWSQIAILVLVAGFAGIIAAIYPSWKASRIDVLDAIAYE